MKCNVVQQIRIHPFRHYEKITTFAVIYSQNDKKIIHIPDIHILYPF